VPRNFLSQKKEKDPEVRQSMGANLMKVFARHFFIYRMIFSLSSFFDVPKGDRDICLVYNGTSSIPNAHLWAPWFALPTICEFLRALELDTFMADSDIGEMFLNFMLEERCTKLTGVYLTHYVERGEGALEGKIHLVRWGRCLMGGTFYPYQTGKGMGHAKEIIMGDPNDEQNFYQWKEVRLNLPGYPDYDPSLAWAAKVREDGRVAADLFIYMDDFRLTGPDADECWRASRKAASICNYLGIQDAPRKRRDVSRVPGPWAGSMVYTDDSAAGVRILVSTKKWAKAKRLLATLLELVLVSDWVDHKVLERIQGFMVYVDRTYKPLTPFLMGLHMSIDGWRPGRDDEGWRLRQAEVEASRDSDEEGDDEGLTPLEETLPPGQVKDVPWLLPDLKV
jgi:hypothetical protein